MRRRGENGRRQFAAQDGIDLFARLENLVPINRGEMGKGAGHRFTTAPLRHGAGKFQVWVAGDQSQQFTGDVAGAAEHDGGHGSHGIYSAARAGMTREPMPMESMIASPRVAGLLMALIAGTFICCSIISTPT